MDLSWPDSTYEQLDAQGRYDNTILALLSLLKAESTRQPLILFIEDVHFLDDDSKKFITRLKRALLAETTSYPIAVLMTTRWQGSRAVLEEIWSMWILTWTAFQTQHLSKWSRIFWARFPRHH